MAYAATDVVRWYPSKIDWWLVPLLALPPVTAIAVCVALAAGGKSAELPIGLAMVLVVVGIYFGLVFPMRYGIDDHQLTVRFGVVRQRVPLADIQEVRPTRNPLSSPALSLDRLAIKFGPGMFKTTMISPDNREVFLDDLARTAGLKRDGDRLVRG